MSKNGLTSRRSATRPRSIGKFAQILRAHLPELSRAYHVKSLGVFGSFVRHQNKPRSDLDVLVEYSAPVGLFAMADLENHLSDLLGVKVDLVPKKGLKPFIGKRVLSEVVWLQHDGVATRTRLPRRALNGKRSGSMMPRKREYLDFLQDIVQAMQFVEQYTRGLTLDDLIHDEMRHDAVVFRIEVAGEAARQIPSEVNKRYAQINWKDMAGMRDRLTHGYWAIDNKILWDVATIDIPREKPLIEHALQEEMRRRATEEKNEME